MKRILILIIGLFGVAHAQFSPTSAKSAFKWGVSIGTRDSTAYAANDSLVVVINRQGRMMYRSTDGYWKLLANAVSSDYVPYTGAVTNVNLGNYRLTARSIKTDSIYANSSAGMYLTTNSGTAVAHWGGGGSVEVDFKGFAGYDANRAGSYTARSFTDKNYVDSSAALRKSAADTFFVSGYTTRARTKQIIDSLGAAKANAADLFISQTILFTDAGWNAGKTRYAFPTPVSSASYNIFNNTINRYLLSSEYTATVDSFTLTSAAQTGDVFILTGALGTLGNYYSRTEIPPVVDSLITVYNDSIKQLSSVKLQARIDRMRKRLTGLSNLQVGLINFWDIGITQSNPDSLLFWHDGTITWPLKKVNHNFSTAWEEGGIIYVDSLGNRWKSISVVKMHDYTLNEPTNEYYVRYATGTDDTTKGTLAKPFKRLSYAFARAVTVAQRDGKPFNIKLLDDWIGADGALGGSPTLPNGVRGKITGTPLSGIDKTRLVGQRESYTDATFAWYSLGGGVWACSTASINNATKMTAMGFDLLYRDADSAPLPMRYIAPQASASATIDSIAGKPSSFGYYNDGGTITLYVHLIDGRKPSVDNWVYEEGIGAQLSFQVGMGSGMILENIERYYTTTGVQLAAVRARPITVTASYQENTGQIWLYNCGIYGSAGQGFQIYDMIKGGTDYLVCKYVREDAENYHSFNLLSYTPNSGGSYMNLHSNFSVSEHLGENWFRDMPALGVSTQAISAHTKINLIALNSVGGYSNGAVAAHVGGVQATHINTHYYYPLQAPSLGPPGSGSPKVVFWADSENASPVTRFNIIGGSGNNFKTSNIFSATNNGQIYYFNQKGKTTTETYNGGTITNLY